MMNLLVATLAECVNVTKTCKPFGKGHFFSARLLDNHVAVMARIVVMICYEPMVLSAEMAFRAESSCMSTMIY